MLKCKTCNNPGPFYKDRHSKTGFTILCKVCFNKEHTERRKRNPVRTSLRRSAARYGITTDQLEMLWLNQRSQCGICKKQLMVSKTAHVDHDHETGKVRGILCSSCNNGLGLFKDSEQLMLAAIAWIKK